LYRVSLHEGCDCVRVQETTARSVIRIITVRRTETSLRSVRVFHATVLVLESGPILISVMSATVLWMPKQPSR